MPYMYKRIRTKHKDFITRTKCICWNFDHTKKHRGVRLRSTGETKQKRNKRNSYLKKKYEIYNNFDVGDMWITLTYSKKNVPETPEEAHKILTNTLSKLRKKLLRMGIRLIYYVKTEAGEKVRVHHHLFIKNNFDVISMLYDYWKDYGKVRDFREIYNLENGNLVKYFLDGGEHKGLDFEKYSHSANLIQPEIETRIYPYDSFREVPRAPGDEDGIRYEIRNLQNFFPDADGYIYQEYELIKIKKEE